MNKKRGINPMSLMHVVLSLELDRQLPAQQKKLPQKDLPTSVHVAVCRGYKKIHFDNAYYDLNEIISDQMKN